MAFNESQTAWLEGLSGLALAKERADTQRSKKDLLATERTVKLAPAKESIKRKLSAASFKKGVFSSVKVLDEEGGQEAEFDYSDVKGDKQFQQEYLVMMQEAMEQISATVAQMRDEQTELIDEGTGAVVLDKNGEPVMVPLYSDEEIAEEVYMPLVRERLMPEWLVPNKWSKTQEMLDASDALYKERLEQYTAEMQDEDQTLLDAGKDATTQLGALAQKALAMVPGAEAELASSIVGLVTLGTTTLITGAQILTKGQLDRSMNTVIDNVGSILSQSLSLATGQDDIGKLAGNVFKATVAGAKMAVNLAQDPPNVDGAIDEFANGLQAALSAGFSGKNLGGAEPSLVSEAAGKSAVLLFKTIASGIRIHDHVLNGDSDAIIAELTAASQETLKTVQSIVTTAMTEGKKGKTKEAIEKQQKELTDRISQGIDLAKAGISTGKKIVDAVKVRSIKGMAEEIVNGIGDVVAGAVKLAAPGVGDIVGNAYRATTKTGLVAYYLTMDPPDKSRALQSLGDGFEAAFAMAGSASTAEALKTVGKEVSKAFVAAGAGIDLGKTIADGKYGDGAKALAKLARAIMTQALKVDLSGDPSVTAEGDEGSELMKGIKIGADTFKELSGIIAEAVNGLKDEKAKAKLQQQLDELRTADALADIESSKEEIERVLIQGDEAGGKAADTRSIEVLIQEMQRDRMIMEMAQKLMSAGATVVEQFVAPMAVGGAAIKLAANLIKATQRASMLNTWINNQKDMHKAVSSFESSAANFVKNQGEQFSHYAIQAALELARMIGEIVSCSGISSAAGVALAKGAALAIAAEEISYQFYKKADLENAWRITQKAWANPDSRKLGLLARKLNPTLAKYTLAWGASVKRDALAQEAMRSCGLNALTLSQKDSNVSQVQKFLETSFNEDNVVLKRYTLPDWMPAVVELTAKSWSIAKTRGETLGGVVPEDAGGIDDTLVQIARLRIEFENQVEAIVKVGYVKADREGMYATLNTLRDDFEASTGHFRDLLLKYNPSDENGKAHKQMRDLKAEFLLVAEETAADIDSSWQELSDALEKVRPPENLMSLFDEEAVTN
ncbi:MAG: hypothetical protein IV097_09610 [Burkholderiaceae bacterium]|nr:hypothetical protein [Burkholderiaceae bacterium]